MEAVAVVRAGRAEDNIGTSRLHHTYNFREFDIITGQHRNGSLLGLEYLNPIACRHIPFVNLSRCNMQLGLLCNTPIGVEQVGCVI
ncbi:hypothetical protein D3C87_1979310 [compost metagenome]